MKKIAVIGAGSTGHAAAADLTLAGFEVMLYEQPHNEEKLIPVEQAGGITIRGVAVHTGFAHVNNLTTDIRDALRDAELVLVAVHAQRHSDIAQLCAPHIRDGQTIVITPGNMGSLVFASTFQEMGVECDVIIADVESSFYACRLVGRAEVIVLLPQRPKYVAAFPARNTPRVIEALAGVYKTLAATNVLEATLNSPNVDLHLLGSLLNTGAIEQAGGMFRFYAQGLTPSVIRCIKALHAEKAAIFQVLGYTDRSKPAALEKIAQTAAFPQFDLLRTAVGPDGMRHRYIDEDASVSISLLISLGEMLGIPTPLARVAVTLASVINEVDYLKSGRTLKNLNLAKLSGDELNRFLAQGPA